jgi:hypothetical protein
MKKFLFVCTILLFAKIAVAAPPSATIEYQPMSGEGLTVGHPFETWVVLDKSADPTVAGYAMPPKAAFRFTFPVAFTPQTRFRPEAVLLYGWPQKAAPIPFTVGLDPQDPRTIVLGLKAAFPAGPPSRPGLKAIHLRWGPVNPSKAGDYTIVIEVLNAGELSGTTQTVAHITTRPLPVVAAYNQLHKGLNEDWQHVRPNETTALPIDLLVTLPDNARSSLSLRSSKGTNLEILSDENPIGTITHSGVPIKLKPERFGPGFARLGIVRFDVTAGRVPGKAEIKAQLYGGTNYTLNVIVGQ